ncbi:hypothetical protein AB0C89_37770 [Streptomyces sp. NPDC048491]|uniref:hypothetical protein n=1 Tax=Streptomyces sp. NPDC048491 TaxID=3157207 RepID=UPI003426D2B4
MDQILPKPSRVPSLRGHRDGYLTDGIRDCASHHRSIQETRSLDHSLPVHSRFGREHLGKMKGASQAQWLPSFFTLTVAVESLSNGREKLSVCMAHEIGPALPEGPPVSPVLRSERPSLTKDIGPNFLEVAS